MKQSTTSVSSKLKSIVGKEIAGQEIKKGSKYEKETHHQIIRRRENLPGRKDNVGGGRSQKPEKSKYIAQGRSKENMVQHGVMRKLVKPLKLVNHPYIKSESNIMKED